MKNKTLFFLVIIVALFTIPLGLSMFQSKNESVSRATVALFANNMTVNIDLENKIYPGSDIIVPILVTNEENNKVSEVSIKYIIEIENTNNLPLEYTLCEDLDCNSIIEGTNKFENDNFKFNKQQKQEKKYYLKISWPIEKNDYEYSNEIDYLKINFIVEQVD